MPTPARIDRLGYGFEGVKVASASVAGEWLAGGSQLAGPAEPMDAIVERLGAAGCDDALVGLGQPGRLALEFIREAPSAELAIKSALSDVRMAVPAAILIEAVPDMVGLTDVADIVGVSRQNMRKLMLTHASSFPVPVHEGSASIWHLADVLSWMQARGAYSFAQSVLDVALIAMRVNVAKEQQRLRGTHWDLESLAN